MKFINCCLLIFISFYTRAQIENNQKDSLSFVIEQIPQYPEGEQAMTYFISQNLVYPPQAIEHEIEGTVKVRFTVAETGQLINLKIISESLKLGYGLEEAAVDVIKKMPKWIPGSENGIPTAMSITLPIKFRLLNLIKKPNDEIIPENVFLISTIKPQFPGGQMGLINFISNSLVYPPAAIKNKIEGKVTLKFIIDTLGKICCIDIMGEPIGYGLEQEAIRIIRSMPDWTPAMQDDHPVAVYYRLPITFDYYEE